MEKLGIENVLVARKCPICGKELRPISVTIGDIKRMVVPACECEIRKFELENELRKRRERSLYLERFFYLSSDERYSGCSVDNFEPRDGVVEALNAVKRYIANLDKNLASGRGLVLYGNVGTGKSHLAFAVHNEAKKRGYASVFSPITTIIDKLDKARVDGKEAEFDLLELLKIADLLVLDDVGVEVKRELSAKRIYDVISGRYNLNKATIITTNLSNQDELVSWLGARVFDRLLETCSFVKLSGSSYRWLKRGIGNGGKTT